MAQYGQKLAEAAPEMGYGFVLSVVAITWKSSATRLVCELWVPTLCNALEEKEAQNSEIFQNSISTYMYRTLMEASKIHGEVLSTSDYPISA